MDWEAEGLLDDCPDDKARTARRELLEELLADGVELETLREAVSEQRLALVPLDRLLGGEPKYTFRDLARESGMELEALKARRRALGLAVPDADDRVFDDDDLDAAHISRKVRDAGFEEDHVLEAARVLGRGMARYAEALRTVSADLIDPEADEREIAARLAAVGSEQLPLAREWLQYVFMLHFRQMLRHEAVTLQERTAGGGDAREQTVAFADLVGFTELGETVPVEELGSVAARLSRTAGDVVEDPVRVVKTIGDAVMLVAPEPAPMVETALTLLEEGERIDDLPPLRIGIAHGPAVNQWGDWFGSTVNLASRLTSRARPSSVLATEEVRNAAADGYAWSSAGPKKLKGFSAPVKAYRVRRADASSPARTTPDS